MPKRMERPTFRKLREHQHLRGTECTNSSSKDDGHMTGTLMKIKARDKQIHRTASALIDPSGHAIEASSCPVRHGMAWHQPPELLHRCCCAENTLPATLMLSCILFALWTRTDGASPRRFHERRVTLLLSKVVTFTCGLPRIGRLRGRRYAPSIGPI